MIYPLIVALIVLWGFFMVGPYFVVQYIVSFPVLQSSRWGRERLLLYFNCFLMSCVSILWLLLTLLWVRLQCVMWYFLVLFTFFNITPDFTDIFY